MIPRLPESVHQAFVADMLRAPANRALLDAVPPADSIVAVDHGKDFSTEVRAHMEGPVMVVDEVRHYCPEHAFTPPEFSGLAFCPYCEFPDLIPADLDGATP